MIWGFVVFILNLQIVLESNDIASVLIRYGKPSEIKVHFDVKEVFSEVNLFVIFDEENLSYEFIGTIPEDG